MKAPKALWITLKARYRTWPRVVQIAAMAIGGFVAIIAIYAPIQRFTAYRAGVQAEIESYQDELEHLAAYVTRGEPVEREREQLEKRLEGLKARLVPGDTGTLAAAHLQDHVTTLANETAVNVQSAQVMREERIGAYRQVTVRLTVRATLKALADFLERAEYGTMHLSVPFLQIDRRGAVRRGRTDVPATAEDRVLSATLELRGLAAANEGDKSDKGEQGEQGEKKDGERGAGGEEASA
jgi:hypothetical protein